MPCLSKYQISGSACKGIDQGPEFGIWLGKFLEKEHLNFRLIWHDYSSKKSSRELRPIVDDLRPMTKQEDLPLFANFYGFLLVNEDSVSKLNEELKSVPMEVDHRRFRPNIVVTGKHILSTALILKSSSHLTGPNFKA